MNQPSQNCNNSNGTQAVLLLGIFFAIAIAVGALFYAKLMGDKVTLLQERVTVLEAESAAMKALDFTGKLKEWGQQARRSMEDTAQVVQEKAQQVEKETQASEKIRALFDVFEELVISTEKSMKKLESLNEQEEGSAVEQKQSPEEKPSL